MLYTGILLAFPTKFMCRNPNAPCGAIGMYGLYEMRVHKSGAFTCGISALIKENPKSFLIPFVHGRTQGNTTMSEPGSGGSLTLNLLTPRS